MRTERLNAFTDGVLAIVITIMVLELPLPKGETLASLRPVLTLLGAYALAFVNVGIYWNNHHHLMQLVKAVDGRVLWANHFLLFWLSLLPFVIRWTGEAHLRPGPVAAYGVVLVMAAVAYGILERAMVTVDGDSADLDNALGSRRKELLSILIYVIGVALAFYWVAAAIACYTIVSAMWFVPDRRVEKKVEELDQ